MRRSPETEALLALVDVDRGPDGRQSPLARQREAGRRISAPSDHASRAQELGPGADSLRQRATEAAAVAEQAVARAKELDARATQAEQRAIREGQSAGRHDEQAAEIEEKL